MELTFIMEGVDMLTKATRLLKNLISLGYLKTTLFFEYTQAMLNKNVEVLEYFAAGNLELLVKTYSYGMFRMQFK
jgi:hypothetical protein